MSQTLLQEFQNGFLRLSHNTYFVPVDFIYLGTVAHITDSRPKTSPHLTKWVLSDVKG
jgi:hypothetical protein